MAQKEFYSIRSFILLLTLMKELAEIKSDIKKNTLKPIYVLDGEEPYYIDVITNLFEQTLLPEHERDFNQSIFYGKDANWSDVVNECRSYPAFATRRLVVLKEVAQMKDFVKLESYMSNPSETTVLVIAHKYKKVDGRSTILKSIKKNGYYATFDKLKDHKLPDWIINYCSELNLKINSMNAELLATYLGNDLQKIANEIEKVSINITENGEVTEDLIEKYIGISKEYNIFQYPSAILEKNAERAFRIANYFMANAKEAPMVVVTATLYGQFCKLYQYHYAKQLPQGEIAAHLKIPPFFVKDYEAASRKYNLSQTSEAIKLIQEYNLNSIGMNVSNNSITLLKEMTAKLIQI
jgi:DNA polymerase III subunit delta